MKYTGVVVAESLIDEAFLNFVSITERKDGVIKFTVTDEFVLAVAQEISKVLKPSCSATIEGEYEKFAISPNQVARL